MAEEFTFEAAWRITLQSLECLERAGVGQLPRPKRRAAPVAAASREGAMPHGTTQESGVRSQEPSAVEAKRGANEKQGADAPRSPDLQIPQSFDRTAALTVLCREVAACTRCHELATTRKQTVFGVGDPHARLCFLGEAPGGDEDQQGEPFVGKAGQLLNKIIEACTLRREQVYILNTIKCRPPGNRNPEPAELANCRGFLDRQLEIIQPEFICCLGAVAAKALLGTEASIGKLRRRFYRHGEIRVLCTYHPAYLLRNPAAKRDVWDDMQLLMGEMGIALPKKS